MLRARKPELLLVRARELFGGVRCFGGGAAAHVWQLVSGRPQVVRRPVELGEGVLERVRVRCNVRHRGLGHRKNCWVVARSSDGGDDPLT